MLVGAAAQRWGVHPNSCSTESSRIFHRDSGRSVTYGDVAADAMKLPVPDIERLRLKGPAEYRLIGRRISGVDNHALVTGEPIFGIDQALPGLHFASYVKCPATGGRVKSANLSKIRSLPGIVDAFLLEGNDNVQQLMPGVAIVGDSTWSVLKAREQLRVEWDETDACCDDSTDFEATARELTQRPGEDLVTKRGNSKAALESAPLVLDAFYSYPFLSHAPLEPQNCTAWFHDGEIEIWAPTQDAGAWGQQCRKCLGTESEDKITVHQTRIGGGFGRRLINDWMCEAAAIAQRTGLPIKLQWTREDDMAHDFYRVAGFHGLRAGLVAGKLDTWEDSFVSFKDASGRPVAGGNLREGEFPAPLVANTPRHANAAAFESTHRPVASTRLQRLRFCRAKFHSRASACGQPRPPGVSARDHGRTSLARTR